MEPPLTHAGGVVFREQNGRTLFLVVSSSDGQSWVLPKGHIDPGETPDVAAVRELAEEAGVLGEIVEELSIRSFLKYGKLSCLQYFLIRDIGTTDSHEERMLRWEDEKAAFELLTFPEAKAALLEGAAALKNLS
jgi:8-oxo-dGTP pyrophosphatase MutT (NUDIX family)